MFQKILDFLKALFTPSPVKTESPKEVGEVLKVSRIPKFGETSYDVKVLQRALVAKGFDPGPIDGLFGSLTKSAVSKFQLKNSMAGSGEPGPQTMMLLGIQVQGTTVIPSTPVQTKGYAPLSWERSDSSRKSWSDYLHRRLDDVYDSFVLKIQDIKRFRPDWDVLNRGQRVNVVAEIICATSKYESGWNPKSSSVDVGVEGKRDTYSIGLMQVSVVDQDWAKPKDKTRYTYEELLTPIPNLDLTLAIMMRQVSKTGLLILPNSSTYRYWAVLLDGNKYSQVDQITAAVRSFVPTGSDNSAAEKHKSGMVPWLSYALQFKGKKETDPEFSKFMVPKWSLFGMNLGTIKENWAAWCGLAMAVALTGVGLNYAKDGSLAKNWANFGDKIEWQRDGIPQGAIVQLNHSSCGSSSGNHVTVANGDCSAADLSKPGAKFDGYGGNQNNEWKVSTYCVKGDCKTSGDRICAVRWPSDAKERPYKVLASKNCSTGGQTTESTR